MEKFRPENSEPANTKHRRRHHARRSGRRGEILKKCVEILENLRSQVSDLRKEAELEKDETTFKEKENGSTKREKLTVAEPVYCSEEDISEKNQGGDESEKIDATNQPDWLRHEANVKPQPDFNCCESLRAKMGKFVAGDLHTRPPETPELPGRSRVDENEGEGTKGKGDCELKEVVAFDREPPPEETPVEEMIPEGSLATAIEGGGTATEVGSEGRGDERSLSFEVEACERFGKEMEARSDWVSREVGSTLSLMGQAQLIKHKGVLEVIREVKNINPHLCLFLPEAFPCVLECKNTNTSSQTAAVSMWDQFINISPLSSFINVEAMGRYANPITDFLEEFVLILGVAYSKNRAVAILCFLLKNTVENRAFDPGGNFSILYITQSSCFKLWNPLFSNYLLRQQYPGLSFTIAAFMAFLNFYKGDSLISVASTHYHKNLVEPQAWSHIIPPLQSESEFSKESIGWLYEWLRGFVGDLNGIIENKPLELHDKEEENNSDFDKSKWHKLMVEHIIQMVESPVAHLWDPGGLTRDEGNPCGIKRDEAMQESANTFVLASHENHFWKEEEVTWLAPFLEGRAAMIFAEKWNGVLMCELVHSGVYHSFISHRVMVLVLYAIPTYEGGAHNGEGLENQTQAWLQTRKEIWVERLIQGLESSRIAMEERHHKPWDPGEPYSASCIIETFCFKLWDPGGRLITVRFGYLHLEDKVNFEGEGIDTDLVNEGQPRQFTKEYERKKWRKATAGPTAALSSALTLTQLILPCGRI